MKPIETRAYGHRFRSRLEARWAVFFTSLGLAWEYEPEGFYIQGVAYLPDFRVWTPQYQPIWYEVKPAHVDEDGKFAKFAKALLDQETNRDPQTRASLLSGDPKHFMSNNTICPRCGQILDNSSIYDFGDEEGFVCDECDIETPWGGHHPIESDGIQGLEYRPHKGWILVSNSNLTRLNRIINVSINNAMSARFEHGESPQ